MTYGSIVSLDCSVYNEVPYTPPETVHVPRSTSSSVRNLVLRRLKHVCCPQAVFCPPLLHHAQPRLHVTGRMKDWLAFFLPPISDIQRSIYLQFGYHRIQCISLRTSSPLPPCSLAPHMRASKTSRAQPRSPTKTSIPP